MGFISMAFEFLSLSFSMCHFLFACCFFAIWHCHFHFWLFDECVCVCESFRAQECLLTTQALHTILTYIARNVSHSFYSFFSGPTSLWLSCHRRFLCVCCCLCCRCLIFCCVVGEMGLDQRMNAWNSPYLVDGLRILNIDTGTLLSNKISLLLIPTICVITCRFMSALIFTLAFFSHTCF